MRPRPLRRAIDAGRRAAVWFSHVSPRTILAGDALGRIFLLLCLAAAPPVLLSLPWPGTVRTVASPKTLRVAFRSDRLFAPEAVPSPPVLPGPARTNPPVPGAPSGESAPAAPGAGDSGRALLDDYLSTVIGRVARHKRFPRLEKERGLESEVIVAFTILKNGDVSDVRLVQSSAHPGFNQEALASVRRSLPLPAIPTDLGRDRIALRIRLKFRLTDD